MKKMLLGLTLALVAAVCSSNVRAASEWGAFGMASEVDPNQNGFGGGAFGSFELTDGIYLNGRAMFGAYDDFDRGQLLLGGEWVDRVGGATGHVGLQAGMDAFDTDAGSEEDAFIRLYYDIGFKVSTDSVFRVGLGYDMKADQIDRKGGLRLGWRSEKEDAAGFFVSGEFYDNEMNVFAGVTWPL